MMKEFLYAGLESGTRLRKPARGYDIMIEKMSLTATRSAYQVEVNLQGREGCISHVHQRLHRQSLPARQRLCMGGLVSK